MRGVLVAIVSLALSPLLEAKEPAYIAIIIDDVGNNFERGERAISLAGSLTYAVLPYAPFTESLANKASDSGKEVMVHMPMANVSHMSIGPGGLEPEMTQENFVGLLNAALARVPHARGINNHMGSFLTQQPTEMGWLMDEVKRRNLFFVDSRTTPKTVASNIARQKSVFASSRDVFLDNELSFFEVDRAFQRLLAKARRNGTAIAIGHPHDVTIDYLEMVLPQLESENIRLIPASNLIALQQMLEVRLAAQ